jgi:hypothetical protein
MWVVMKAFKWESLEFEVEGVLRVGIRDSWEMGERFLPVFDDYKQAKKFADKNGTDLFEIKPRECN